jgi:hypothetical protein
LPLLFGQLLLGLINGSFYAMLSLGLAARRTYRADRAWVESEGS